VKRFKDARAKSSKEAHFYYLNYLTKCYARNERLCYKASERFTGITLQEYFLFFSFFGKPGLFHFGIVFFKMKKIKDDKT
jgi:hypothetical protein